MTSQYYKEAHTLSEYMITHRRTIHRNPELSFNEFQTCDYICKELEQLSIPYRIIANTGVVAHIGTGKGNDSNCVALRADIDALPINEETGLEYSSRTSGVMHACGHDAHTAMLLGAAKILKSKEGSLQGVVKLIFQPGEEKSPGGASIMIREGVFDDYTPSAVFGQHVNPDAEVGVVELIDGPMLASADELYWTLKGSGAHAAQPHKGYDPIIAAASLISHLQTLITRQKNPLDPGVISITSIHGGSATNIIPEFVEMKGTLRSFNSEWRRWAMDTIITHSKSICSLHGVECTVTIIEGYPPLINNSDTTSFAKHIAIELLGKGSVMPFEPKMWAEDFAFYAEKIPSTFWMVGCRPDSVESMPGLHNSMFAPDEKCLPIGTALLTSVAINWLERNK